MIRSDQQGTQLQPMVGVPGETAVDILSPSDFQAFRQLIYDVAGIHLSFGKLPMLSNRLRRRRRQLGLATFADYYRYLRQQGSSSQEFYRFLEAVTTNETYFLRNRPLWASIENHVLPTLMDRRPGDDPLVFWCAASSSGEEPYTLAILLHANRHILGDRPVRILASDISQKQLSTAREACYDAYAVSRLSRTELGQYFAREGEYFRLRPEYHQNVEFFFHNLKQPMCRGPVDCAILRNVLMYFDESMKFRAMQTVAEPLRTGGMMILGDVDQLRSQPEYMDMLGVRFVRPWTYEKIV